MAKHKQQKTPSGSAGDFAANREKGYLRILTRIYVIFVLAVYPLYVGPEGYDNIILRKAQVYWGITLLFLFLFALFYLAHRLGLGKVPGAVKWYKKLTIPDWAVLAFFVALTISMILSPYKSITFLGWKNRNDGWLTMFCMLASYFVISRWYKPRQLDFALFAASASVFCIIGFLQFYGYDIFHFFPHQHYLDGEGNPLFSGFSISFRSTIGNIDFVSAYVCMTVAAFAALYTRTKGPLRFLYLAASVMNYLFMIIANADSGKVGVLGAIVLLVPYWFSEKKIAGRAITIFSLYGISYALHHWFMLNKIMPKWEDTAPINDIVMRNHYSTLPLKPILTFSVLALALGIILSLPKPDVWPKPKTARIAGAVLMLALIAGGLLGVEIIGRDLPPQNIVHQASELLNGRMQDSFGSNRGYIWRKALEAYPRQPFFGTGPDTFRYAFGDSAQREATDLYGVYFDKAHNDFLQILLCTGILSLISYLAVLGGILYFSVKKAFSDEILFMAAATVAAYVGQSFFGIDSLTVTPVFWLMIAVARQRQTAMPQNTVLEKS